MARDHGKNLRLLTLIPAVLLIACLTAVAVRSRVSPGNRGGEVAVLGGDTKLVRVRMSFPAHQTTGRLEYLRVDTNTLFGAPYNLLLFLRGIGSWYIFPPGSSMSDSQTTNLEKVGRPVTSTFDPHRTFCYGVGEEIPFLVRERSTGRLYVDMLGGRCSFSLAVRPRGPGEHILGLTPYIRTVLKPSGIQIDEPDYVSPYQMKLGLIHGASLVRRVLVTPPKGS